MGFRVSNIWKVWFPRTNSCKYVRDATFDENLNFANHPTEPPRIRVIDFAEVLDEDELDAELERAIRQAGAMPIVQNDVQTQEA